MNEQIVNPLQQLITRHNPDSRSRIDEYSADAGELLNHIEGTKTTPDGCNLSIQIPAYYKERNLKKTLLFYSQQQRKGDKPVVLIIININGPSLAEIEKSEALRDTQEAARQYPDLNICIVKQAVAQKDFKIGHIRGCTSMISMMRALENPNVDLDNMIVVTNDADLWGLSPNYLANIYEYFKKEAQAQAVGTFIDYPREQISTNHLGIVVQRCEEMLELLDKKRHKHMILRSGSSAYRMAAFIQAGTFPKARKGESGQLVRNIRKKYGPLAVKLMPRYLATLTTSARRHATAVYRGTSVTDRYISFGTADDLSLLYHDADNGKKARETVVIAQDPDFIERLSKELTVLYKKRVNAVRGEYSRANEADVQSGEIEEDVLEGLKMEVQKDFTKIAPFLGIKISFSDEDDILRVENIDKLRDNLRERFSVFD